jgi:hypothetical protein
MRDYVALLALTLIMAGCDTRDKTQELQQQKLSLDLIKAQNEQLAAAMKSQEEKYLALKQKENDLNNWEKSNREASQEIEQQKASLEKLQAKITQEELSLKAEKEKLETESKKIQADAIKNQEDRQEIGQKLTAIKEREEAERLAHDPEYQALLKRQAEEQKRQKVIADRIKEREPILQQLTTEVIGVFGQVDRVSIDGLRSQSIKPTKTEANNYKNIFLKKLTSPTVAGIEEDKAFISEVNLVVWKTYEKITESRVDVYKAGEESRIEGILKAFERDYYHNKSLNDYIKEQ